MLGIVIGATLFHGTTKIPAPTFMAAILGSDEQYGACAGDVSDFVAATRLLDITVEGFTDAIQASLEQAFDGGFCVTMHQDGHLQRHH